jgi:hypothetical protein
VTWLFYSLPDYYAVRFSFPTRHVKIIPPPRKQTETFFSLLLLFLYKPKNVAVFKFKKKKKSIREIEEDARVFR